MRLEEQGSLRIAELDDGFRDGECVPTPAIRYIAANTKQKASLRHRHPQVSMYAKMSAKKVER